MDKYIKLDPGIWKKLRLAATLDDKAIKTLSTKYIITGLRRRFHGNKDVIKCLSVYRNGAKIKEEEGGK